jgi:transcription elongation factor GreA
MLGENMTNTNRINSKTKESVGAVSYLTPKGKEMLEKELDNLQNQKPIISAEIETAKELGDLSENAGYTAAKEAMSRLVSRIDEIETLLRISEVVENSKGSERVALGSKVTIKINNKEVCYSVVSGVESDPINGLISYESPIGQSLMGRGTKEKIKIATPGGEIEAEIIDIE